jgi:hypothetical protein
MPIVGYIMERIGVRETDISQTAKQSLEGNLYVTEKLWKQVIFEETKRAVKEGVITAIKVLKEEELL